METKKLYEYSMVQEKCSDYNVIARANLSSEMDEVLREVFDSKKIGVREYFYTLYLSNNNKIIGYSLLSVGGINATIVDTRILFREALLLGAVSIVISHNHPSGSLKPSSADIEVTKKIKQIGEFIGIPLLDHIILTENAYYSFSDEGII